MFYQAALPAPTIVYFQPASKHEVILTLDRRACELLHSVNVVVMVNTVCKYVLSTGLLGTTAF